MNVITVPIGVGRTDLCKLIERVETGTKVVFTSHGKPKAVLSAYHQSPIPWRVTAPDDPKHYGDLQSPAMDDWK